MSPNLNTSIWMTSPPTKHPGTLVHINLSQPPPSFSFLQEPFTIPKLTEDNFQFDTKDDINRMDLCNSPMTHHQLRQPLSLGKNLRKNGELYGRSSQSSQINPGNLQQSLSLPPRFPTKASLPPVITAVSLSPPLPSPTFIP